VEPSLPKDGPENIRNSCNQNHHNIQVKSQPQQQNLSPNNNNQNMQLKMNNLSSEDLPVSVQVPELAPKK
jgi:hypothetical protein